MRRRRRSSFRKEKAIMLVSSCLVLTALTATGLYVRNRGQEKEEDNYIVDFTTLDEANRDKAGEAQDLGEQQADAGELDYDPSFQEANSGKVDNPDMKMLAARQTPESRRQRSRQLQRRHRPKHNRRRWHRNHRKRWKQMRPMP